MYRMVRHALRGASASAIAATLFVGGVGVASTIDGHAVSHDDSVRCEEDQPCWNWQEMGNRSSGATLDIHGSTITGVVTVNEDYSMTFRAGDTSAH